MAPLLLKLLGWIRWALGFCADEVAELAAAKNQQVRELEESLAPEIDQLLADVDALVASADLDAGEAGLLREQTTRILEDPESGEDLSAEGLHAELLELSI